MEQVQKQSSVSKIKPLTDEKKSNLPQSNVALGGVSILALLTASCCILPLGLTIIGLGGSWLSILGPFVAYRSYLLLIVGGIVVWSWISLWRSPCGIFGDRTAFIIRFVVTIIFLAALSAPYWEDELARSMWEHLRDSR